MVIRGGPCQLGCRGLLAAVACSAAMRARALAKVSAMLVLAELLYWNAALVIGTLGKVGRAACMGSPVEGKRKARSAVAGGLVKSAGALVGMPGEVIQREGGELPGPAKTETIWCDHCRLVRNCRQPRPIPELSYLIEWSHRMAPLEPCGGRHMHAARYRACMESQP